MMPGTFFARRSNNQHMALYDPTRDAWDVYYTDFQGTYDKNYVSGWRKYQLSAGGFDNVAAVQQLEEVARALIEGLQAEIDYASRNQIANAEIILRARQVVEMWESGDSLNLPEAQRQLIVAVGAHRAAQQEWDAARAQA